MSVHAAHAKVYACEFLHKYYQCCVFLCVCVCAHYVHMRLLFHMLCIHSCGCRILTVRRHVCVCEVCVCMYACAHSNNDAWWTGASFDAMKADKRETGPIRHVALPINPFHRVKPNIIAWGAWGH